MSTALHLGRWQDVWPSEKVRKKLAVDVIITDTPFSARTHKGQKVTRADNTQDGLAAKGFSYQHWTPADVNEFVEAWSPVCRGWMVILTDHVLGHAWETALNRAERYTFQPLPAVMPGSNVRILGDGPSSCTVWVIVARPKNNEFLKWGTTRSDYRGPREHDRDIAGQKPLWLMRELVSDYSRPGDLVCDPCAGSASTLLAAVIEGRRAIGAEVDPETHRVGLERLPRSRAGKALTARGLKQAGHGACGGVRWIPGGHAICACGEVL